ncbi:MAG: hypothetical protein ACXVWW_08340 [Nocardioides sp.]
MTSFASRSVVLTAAGVLAIAGIAGFVDSASAKPASVRACVDDGDIRVLSGKQDCKAGEQPITWSVKPQAGPIGPRGATGPAGPAGATGETGAVGPQGPVGPAGSGAQGPAGPVGPKGDKGDTGATGATGAMGMPGMGMPGMQGPAGATGATGATGLTGPQGPKGDTGDTGPAGAKGDKGDKGDTGSPGGFSGVTYVPGNAISAGPNETRVVGGGCAPGTVAIGGGIYSSDLNAPIGNMITKSYPSDASGVLETLSPTNWTIAMYVADTSVTAYTVCAG